MSTDDRYVNKDIGIWYRPTLILFSLINKSKSSVVETLQRPHLQDWCHEIHQRHSHCHTCQKKSTTSVLSDILSTNRRRDFQILKLAQKHQHGDSLIPPPAVSINKVLLIRKHFTTHSANATFASQWTQGHSPMNGSHLVLWGVHLPASPSG